MRGLRLGLGIGPRRTGTPVFDPLTLSPLAWYRDTITTGATLTWADLTGHGNNLVQITAANQPAKISSDADFRGNPSLSWDGSNDYLGTAGNLVIGGPTAEIWITAKVTAGSSSKIIETSITGVGNNVGALQVGWNQTTSPIGTGVNGWIKSNAGNTWIATNAPGAQPVAIGVLLDISTNPDTVAIRYGNVLQSASANAGIVNGTINIGDFPMFVGARSGGSVGPTQMKSVELLVMPRALTAGERTLYYAYLTARYGV